MIELRYSKEGKLQYRAKHLISTGIFSGRNLWGSWLDIPHEEKNDLQWTSQEMQEAIDSAERRKILKPYEDNFEKAIESDFIKDANRIYFDEFGYPYFLDEVGARYYFNGQPHLFGDLKICLKDAKENCPSDKQYYIRQHSEDLWEWVII